MRAASLHDALERLTAAIRDVESELAAMKAEHDPLASHIFVARRRYRNVNDTKSGKRRGDVGPAEFRYCLQPRLSRQPGRVGAAHGSSCEAVNARDVSVG